MNTWAFMLNVWLFTGMARSQELAGKNRTFGLCFSASSGGRGPHVVDDSDFLLNPNESIREFRSKITTHMLMRPFQLVRPGNAMHLPLTVDDTRYRYKKTQCVVKGPQKFLCGVTPSTRHIVGMPGARARE